MMINAPSSLTATVHIKFNYGPEGSSPVPTEMLNRVFDHASEMSPELREILVKFADFLDTLEKKEESGP